MYFIDLISLERLRLAKIDISTAPLSIHLMTFNITHQARSETRYNIVSLLLGLHLVYKVQHLQQKGPLLYHNFQRM